MTTKTDAPATDTAAKRYATKDFTDAGTGRSFKLNDTFDNDVDPGMLANYEAAGLASDVKTKVADAA